MAECEGVSMGATVTKLEALDSYVVLDTETTGLDLTCELIEVGAVRVSEGQVVDSFDSLVRPEHLPIPHFIETFTGISSEVLKDAPLPSHVMNQLVAFVGDNAVVGHNVCFDMRFVRKACNSCGIELPRMTLVDTKRISQHVFPSASGRSLSDVVSLCEECGGRSCAQAFSHRALYDVEKTQFAYEVMKPLLVELYGSNPEDGFRRARAERKASYPSARLGDLEPTVDEIDESNPFYGMTLCFTGKLDSMTRAEAAQKAVNCGALVKTSVTKKLDYLVLGKTDFIANIEGNKTSKLLKAEKLISDGASLQVISEDFFLQMIGGIE